MKRALSLVVLLVVLAGCKATPAFVRGVDAQWAVIGPEYRAYVQTDSSLSNGDKATRLRTAETLDELIQAERARHE